MCVWFISSDSELHQRRFSTDNIRIPTSIPFEVHPLIISGSAENRVDLVFFADGYVEAERQKFLDDSLRLAEDISGNQTFYTVKPLMNFWAAFAPSNESGIGSGGKPKDTVLGLYRDGTELRAVYYSKPEVVKAMCSQLGAQCDYPILLGNDPYYGGLGGEFTVITASLANGPLVLRHELGHSIIEVGEEYDGGFAYFGANAANDLSAPLPWAHWLSDPHADPRSPRVERSVMPMQAYPWTMLNTTTAWSVQFTSSGSYPRHLVRFSLSGIPEATDLKIELDGRVLRWTPKPGIGLDRWHYDIHQNFSLTGGVHELKFTLLNGGREGTAQLCSAELLEFGDESEFHSNAGYYGIFPTFSDKNTTSYRPTNEDCLMRIVTTPNFCKACLEALWLSLLRRVNFIDDIKETCAQRIYGGGRESQHVSVKTLAVQFVPLADFRQDALELRQKESYTILWYRNNQILDNSSNKTVLEISNDQIPGNFTISVKFASEEIRVDKEGLLERKRTYEVTKRCDED
ncbi:hypothetical protein AMATHDRAFT_73063 [Amanita thiersii Skay4041]|uniref:Peptidase M64 N-terminal domain-containing protein n=1 Tax=Amanita thiersii Skay4041 TaxID=703135 RepID=A0A2A9NU26_9AGAR|nr:hypothetical protein AMATHDRAFT_73063 [Amanita thiersii Skay4041]